MLIQIYQFFIVIAMAAFYSTAILPGSNWDFEIQRIDPLLESSEILAFNFKPTRFNKTLYVINGNITLIKDLSQGYDIEIKLYHSSKGNNQFVLAPFRLMRQPFSAFINKDYRKYIMNTMSSDLTNLPISKDPNVQLIKLFKWNYQYTLKNYLFDKKQLPQLEEGLYKLVITIFKGLSIAGGFTVLARVIA